jgi:hypothetical protein
MVPALLPLIPQALQGRFAQATKKAADFSTAFCTSALSSKAADAHAHAGNADANTATFFITTAIVVPLARRVVTVGVADDDASVIALTPATAVFVAYHADVLDVAVVSHR